MAIWWSQFGCGSQIIKWKPWNFPYFLWDWRCLPETHCDVLYIFLVNSNVVLIICLDLGQILWTLKLYAALLVLPFTVDQPSPTKNAARLKCFYWQPVCLHALLHIHTCLDTVLVWGWLESRFWSTSVVSSKWYPHDVSWIVSHILTWGGDGTSQIHQSMLDNFSEIRCSVWCHCKFKTHNTNLFTCQQSTWIHQQKCQNTIPSHYGDTIIYRLTILYSLVRPHVESASAVWSLHEVKPIYQLEMVLHRATRWTLNPTTMLEDLQWRTLESGAQTSDWSHYSKLYLA